jgi:translocation and assembly module TamB
MADRDVSSEPTRRPDPQPHRVKRRLLALAKGIFAFFVFPTLIGALVLPVLLNNARFHSLVINRLQEQASNSLGVPVHLQNFALHLSTLSVDLYGITVSGAAPYHDPPLLQVQHVEAGVRIVSVVHSKWYLERFKIDRPVIQLFVDQHGVSNIPIFKSSDTSNNNALFDLGIRHAVLENGVVYYNNQPSALALDLHNVNLDTSFNSLLNSYTGTLSYTDGHLTYGTIQPPLHNVSVKFDASPTTLHLTPLALIIGNTQLTLAATVSNYSSPSIQAQYRISADGSQLATVLHNPSLPTGTLSASGSLQYQWLPGRTLLDCLQLNGDLTSSNLNVKTASVRTEVRNLIAHYSLANNDLVLRDLQATLFGGQIDAHGTMKDIGGDRHSQAEATLHGISLAAIHRTFGNPKMPDVSLDGSLNATTDASWGKTFDDLIARADATINGHVMRSRRSMNRPLPSTRLASSNEPTGANAVSLQGAIHATYNGKEQRLSMGDSYIRTPQTNLTMNGTVSKRSNLKLSLQANDLREVESIADFFRTPSPGSAPPSFGLAGSASFQGAVNGSTAAPHLVGQLTAQDLQFNGTTWKVLRTNVDLGPSQISLQHAELQPASRGNITFDATVALTRWSFSKTSPVQLQLTASRIDVGELVKLAQQQLPITGTLNAQVALHGSELNPIGSGNVELLNVTAYGESVSSAQVHFSGSGDEAHADLSVRGPAGGLQGKVSVRPKDKTYTASLSSPGIHLDKLKTVMTSNVEITGELTLKANGAGTFDNPQLDATLEIPNLLIQKQSVSDVKLQMNVTDHFATARLASSAFNTSIRANAKISLTGEYLADASLDTQGIPLGPFLATYAPERADNISGQTEVHATLHGPLKDRQKLEAHITIPTLKLAYGNTVQLAAVSPIHADYKDGVINVQRTAIRGTDTDLQFQGSIPTSGDAPMSLLLLGSVNLQLAQMFDPDLRSSGEIRFNINSYGPAGGPNLGGTIEIVDASLAYPDTPVGLQHASGTLTLSKDRINISKFQGTVGGGTLTAQGGVSLRPAVQFNMGLAAQGVRVLYPQGMRESVDANLRFTGSTDAALLGGSVNVTELSFTRAFDLTDFINQFSGGVETPPSKGFSQNVALNLSVRSSNNVNLVSRTLSVGGSANLQVRGTAAEPVILGRANLSGGDVIFNGNRYVLTGGTVQFVNPSQTEPVINLSMNTTIQQYNINLRFNGPIEQLHTQYSSDPSLPSADIINLLAFGKTQEASAASATPANQAAQSIVASQVSSQVTSRISKIAGISQLSINPVLPNSSTQGSAGANITIQQRVTGNLFIRFSTNVASTQGQTVQGQYQLSPRVAVSATRDPNGGFAVDTLIKKTW